VDTWAGPFADELVGDFGDKKAAMDAAKGAEGEHVKVYVYDDAGTGPAAGDVYRSGHTTQDRTNWVKRRSQSSSGVSMSLEVPRPIRK
jgi:hypothetical protein